WLRKNSHLDDAFSAARSSGHPHQDKHKFGACLPRRNAFQGNWTVGIYLDQNADQQQAQPLGNIFSGQAGGWPAVSRTIRDTADRASPRPGSPWSSQRRQALAFVAMAATGWLISWAMDATNSPIVDCAWRRR